MPERLPLEFLNEFKFTGLNEMMSFCESSWKIILKSIFIFVYCFYNIINFFFLIFYLFIYFYCNPIYRNSGIEGVTWREREVVYAFLLLLRRIVVVLNVVVAFDIPQCDQWLVVSTDNFPRYQYTPILISINSFDSIDLLFLFFFFFCLTNSCILKSLCKLICFICCIYIYVTLE